MNRVAIVLVAVALGAGSQPAVAAEQDIGYGITCGGTVAETTEGQFYGVVTGGPWWVDGAAARVAVRCVIEAMGPEGWYPVSTASSGTPGPSPATVLPTPTSFGVPPTSGRVELQMCTEITISQDPQSPPTVHRVDADNDPSNGGQCEKTERAEGDMVYTGVWPPKPGGGRRCTWVYPPDDLPPPPGPNPNPYCVPSPV